MSAPTAAPADVLAGWTRSSFTAGGISHDTYRRGSGPGVIVIHEIPGITPKVLAFAEDVVDAYRSSSSSYVAKPPAAVGSFVRAVAASPLDQYTPR